MNGIKALGMATICVGTIGLSSCDEVQNGVKQVAEVNDITGSINAEFAQKLIKENNSGKNMIKNPLEKTFGTAKLKRTTEEILKESDEECWDE